MPAKKDDPLRKVTLNLYDSDCDEMKAYYGHGWTEHVRTLVHDHIRTATAHHKVRRTLGDLHDEQSS